MEWKVVIDTFLIPLLPTVAANFTMVQFGVQSAFLITVIAISFALGLDDVNTAQVSQAINTLISSVFFYVGWKLLPHMPAARPLEEGKSLLWEGFHQVFHTAKRINNTFRCGLRWYLLAVIFAEAAANAFTVVAVVYLDEHKGLTGTEIGIFFLVVLLASLPGSYVQPRITGRLDPNRSWQLCMFCLMVWAAGGAVLTDAFDSKAVAYAWGVGIGVFLGWFYPTENLFFSMCLPKGQEAVSDSLDCIIVWNSILE